MRTWLCDLRLLACATMTCVLALGGCTTNSASVAEAPPAAPAIAPEIPASIRPDEVIGRWGYGSYHRPEDLARTETAARAQCTDPVLINRGPTGGVMMYLADSAQLRELQLKGSPSGKNYIGPPGPPAGLEDREIFSFDGRTMVLKWMDPEIAGRYGIGVYVRCAAASTARAIRRPPPSHQ